MANGSKVMAWSGGIDNNAMEQICWFLLRCKKEDKDAVLLLSSGGGELTALFAISDTLRATKVHLTVIGRGIVASAAATLFCMGDERILLPSAKLLMHNARRSFQADSTFLVSDFKEMAESAQSSNEANIRLICEKTGITPELYKAKCGNHEDWWLTPDEVEKYGVTTEPYSDRWVEIVLDALNIKQDK